MRFIVETDNQKKGISLIQFLRANGYTVNLNENIPLTDDDWILPGRAATDEEHEAMAKAMENEKSGEEANIVLERIIKKIQMCSA